MGHPSTDENPGMYPLPAHAVANVTPIVVGPPPSVGSSKGCPDSTSISPISLGVEGDVAFDLMPSLLKVSSDGRTLQSSWSVLSHESTLRYRRVPQGSSDTDHDYKKGTLSISPVARKSSSNACSAAASSFAPSYS